jgi:SanA protein
MPKPILLALCGAVVLSVVLLVAWIPRWQVERRMAWRIYSIEDVPPQSVAIVFGAGLRRNGQPTAMLTDRIKTAVALYEGGKVSLLLMSGHAEGGYDEPGAMRDLALRLGVPEQAILLDRGGSRTYETCWRAKQLYGIDRAILITQAFHLPRALLIAEGLQIDAAGVAADLRTYRSIFLSQLREIPATIVALWELHIQPPRQGSSEVRNG